MKKLLLAISLLMSQATLTMAQLPTAIAKDRGLWGSIATDPSSGAISMGDYKNANNKYTADFDSLIQFCQTAEIPIVKIVPDPTDTTFTRTINDTIGFVKVMDSLRAGRDNFNINDIKWVPFSQPQQQFELEAGTILRNGINIPVFEARTPYEVYLATPGAAFSEKEWNQRRDNAKAEKESINRYAGMKVGSMDEATTDGNWEKL